MIGKLLLTEKDHDVVTNEDTLLILQDYQHVEIALKLVNDTIQVKSLGYGEMH